MKSGHSQNENANRAPTNGNRKACRTATNDVGRVMTRWLPISVYRAD
jgi:hypothetical protein